MEWIFFVTKPSFFDVFSLQDKLMVLLLTGILVSVLGLLAFGVLYGFGTILRLHQRPRLFILLLNLLPACILGAAMLLLIDNFTYTLFSFGIATSTGIARAGYAGLLLVLIGWSGWEMVGAAATLQAKLSSNRIRRTIISGIGIWLGVGMGLGLLINGGTEFKEGALEVTSEKLSRAPHILWITGDGISAEHLSLYGYERDTCPNLNEIAQSSLIAENAFSNSKNSAGSFVSLFTGKNPLETKVLFAPDILHGKDAYQHLPGILRAQGYNTIQYGFTYYVDAYTVNMLDGFNIVNGRSLTDNTLQEGLRRYLSEEMSYFVSEIAARLSDRIQQIFYIKQMQNPYKAVVSDAQFTTDDQRIDSFLESLDGFEQPMFIHLHLMSTHGPEFILQQQIYSIGQDPSVQQPWEADFYDDSILEFDTDVGRILDALKLHGLLDQTLLIISSDHAANSDQRQRIPLVIRFPGGEITGKVERNVQGMDLAPTILDYLGLTQPDWMSGQSILDTNIKPRYIYGAGAGHLEQSTTGRWRINAEKRQPPFFQVGAVSVIDCQRWYELNLIDITMVSGDVLGHTTPCPIDELVTTAEAYDLLLGYLSENGYAIDALESLSSDSFLDGN